MPHDLLADHFIQKRDSIDLTETNRNVFDRLVRRGKD
jgi:hypothetical protein